MKKDYYKEYDRKREYNGSKVERIVIVYDSI